MIVVINAGGSGTRLWPLSTPDYPKHLLKIASEKSLLQETYERVKQLSDHIYIVTEAGHAHHVKEQLPELGEDAFIIEPARRGTAGCIVACLSYIDARHDHDEVVAFLPADHVIRDSEGFIYSFENAAKASSAHNKVTLVGIEPSRPSTGFGYIEKDSKVDGDGLAYTVKGFKEKPDQKTAQQYVLSGRYLWNGGYFVGSVNTFKNALQKFSPTWFDYYQNLVSAEDESAYKNAYLAIEADAIDYALLEVDPELLVVPANFDWMDVGSFTDVHSAIDTDAIGNHVAGKNVALVDVENSLVINEEPEKQIGVIGLDNVVVINTPHGLIVTRKDQDQKVKDIVTKLKEQND